MKNQKVIWITGASSGIGEALVYELAKQNVQLILSARNEEKLNLVKSQAKLPDENCKILPLDLEDSKSLENKTKKAISFFNQVDQVFHCGGFSQRSLAKNTNLSLDRKIMEVDYFGTIAISKYLLPHFLERNSGHFIAISSLAGKFGVPYRTGYAAAKHALHGFFDSLRCELDKTNIKVLIVCPGYIKTDISLNALQADGAKRNKMDKNQADGMSASKCAKKILKAVSKNKFEVVIGGKETFGIYIKRFFPRLIHKLASKENIDEV